jgi:membrane protease YdiL (CAAX protease family)
LNFFASPTLLAAIPFVLLNPIFEELIVRSYLMTEIIDLTGSVTLAVALSLAVQVSYHLYYGWWGALSLAFQFLVFALYYARWRRALPIIIAHGMFDLVGFVYLVLHSVRGQ